jgi:PEP-CTERM motif
MASNWVWCSTTCIEVKPSPFFDLVALFYDQGHIKSRRAPMLKRTWQVLAALACSALIAPAFSATTTVVLDELSWLRLNSTFTASKNFASWLKLHETAPAPVGPASVSTTTVPYRKGDGSMSTFAAATVSTPIQSITLDQDSGAIHMFTTSGGMHIDDRAMAPQLQSPGGQLSIEDLIISFSNDRSAQIYGRLRGQSITGAVVEGWLLLFKVAAADISGLTPFTWQSPELTLSRLTISADGFDAMATALGLDPQELSYTALQATAGDFGSIHIGSPVPEPSSLALMALGLIALSAAASRASTRALADPAASRVAPRN